MTIMTSEQAQATMQAFLDAHKTAWHSLGARCKTGEPFTREEGTEILEVLIQSLDVYLGLARRLVKTSSPLIPVSELMAMAEQVAARLQELVQRVCGDVAPSHHVPKPSQQST
jgi:hypothetical protein